MNGEEDEHCSFLPFSLFPKILALAKLFVVDAKKYKNLVFLPRCFGSENLGSGGLGKPQKRYFF